MPEPRTRVRLCGQLAVEIDGRDATAGLPSGQAEALVCFLLANHDRPVDRGELIAVVWPERPPRDPGAALRPILSRLRRALAPATIEGRDRLRLALPEPVWVDVDQAASELEQARRAGSWEAARGHARTAADLVAPGFLPHHDEDWARERRRLVEELSLEAVEWVGSSSLAGGELGEAERAARELVARSRYRESGHRLLMEALAAAGNVAEALRVYEDLRLLLRDELGVTPAPEIVELHGRLLAGESARDRVPLPAILAPRGRGAFIGRAAELDALREAWASARTGHRRFVLLSGPPGIGKTRLTAELARAAHADGTVLYGSCPQEPLLSYQPFVEALRHYVRNAVHAVRPGTGAAELAQLIPELEIDPVPGPAPDDPETRRYLMFEAVSLLLSDACVRAPVVLVLDDLHWADRPTLQLLRHVLRAQDEAPLLIVGTQREGEGAAELGELLADLRRERMLQGVSLDGLDEESVAALIAAHAGHEAPSALVRTVHDETDGNPFFVEEVVLHLLESGRWTATLTPGQIGVPEGVKDVLLRRLARLSDACRATLADAAVLGREFDFETLRLMGERDEDAVIAALEEALEARLVVEAPGGYAFTHALVRETLYGTLSVPRRQRMHARAAGAWWTAPPRWRRWRCTIASPERPATPRRRSTARCVPARGRASCSRGRTRRRTGTGRCWSWSASARTRRCAPSCWSPWPS